MSFKIRFNLGRGENFEKWRITDNTNGESFYLNPDDFCLTLVKCTLRNQKGAAERIYKGSNKTVCAWIDCEDILAGMPRGVEGQLISYNPRVTPNWRLEEDNIDGKTFDKLLTDGRNVIWQIDTI